MDTRPQKLLRRLNAGADAMKFFVEASEMFGSCIGKRGIRLGPDIFSRIKLRRIGGEVFHVNAGVLLKKRLHPAVAVDGAPVPQKDNGSPQMPKKLGEKCPHIQSLEVPGAKAKIQRHAFSFRRYRKRGDGRDPVLFVPVVKVRGLPFRRPGALNVGDEQKPALIKKREMRAENLGFFLSGATAFVSMPLSLSRLAVWPAARASDSSSPSLEARARHGGDDTVSQSVSVSPSPPALASISR